MSEAEVHLLNERFGAPGRLVFTAGPGGFPVAEISNDHATATVALHGAQPLAFQPRGQAPVLWVSRQAAFAPGKAIRGGIPICWPWFGPHPSDPAKPSHGFARTRPWRVLQADAASGSETTLRLGLSDDEATRALWPHRFELELLVSVGRELQVTLVARNPGPEPFTCTGALHSYFAVGDVPAVAIHGLDGCDYLDQIDGHRRKTQAGAVTFAGEVDRIYLDTDATCTIEDGALGRRIEVAKRGSRATIVWNPWVEKARRLSDFGDDEYRGMVCVETANAGEDVVTVPPGGEHQLAAMIGVR